MQSFVQNKKAPNLELKMLYCCTSRQHLAIFQNPNFRATQKIFKFRTDCFLCVFLGCNFEKLLSYLKSTFQICQNAKLRAKKNPQIWNQKNLYLGIFRHLTSAPSNMQNEKFCAKQKIFKFGTGLRFLDIFGL